jgi:hypothetical protein
MRARRIFLQRIAYTVIVGGRPTVTFFASPQSEAKELLREHWFRELLTKRSGGQAIWDGLSPLAARSALPNEQQHFETNAPPGDECGDDLVLVYLLPVD